MRVLKEAKERRSDGAFVSLSLSLSCSLLLSESSPVLHEIEAAFPSAPPLRPLFRSPRGSGDVHLTPSAPLRHNSLEPWHPGANPAGLCGESGAVVGVLPILSNRPKSCSALVVVFLFLVPLPSSFPDSHAASGKKKKKKKKKKNHDCKPGSPRATTRSPRARRPRWSPPSASARSTS